MLLRILGRSDRLRWLDEQNLHQNWDERTELLAQWIRKGESVLEFGSGAGSLKRFVPRDSSLVHTDIFDRGRGYQICDLNARRLPHLEPADVIVLSGVLEYVKDVERALAYFNQLANAVVLSYAGIEQNPTNRRENGWVNDLSIDDLVGLFEQNDFRMTERANWKRQDLLRFDSERLGVY